MKWSPEEDLLEYRGLRNNKIKKYMLLFVVWENYTELFFLDTLYKSETKMFTKGTKTGNKFTPTTEFNEYNQKKCKLTSGQCVVVYSKDKNKWRRIIVYPIVQSRYHVGITIGEEVLRYNFEHRSLNRLNIILHTASRLANGAFCISLSISLLWESKERPL